MRCELLILTLEELAIVDANRLFTSLTAPTVTQPLVIRIATDMLCNERSNVDAAFDWLSVLMLGEFLATLDCDPQWASVGHPERILAVDFTLNKSLDRTGFDALHAYAASYLSFYSDGRYPAGEQILGMFDYEQELLSFEDDIQSRVLRFDNIASRYTTRFVAGLRDSYLGADYVTNVGRHQLRLKRWMDYSALRCSA
jgi:hypothetical protein